MPEWKWIRARRYRTLLLLLCAATHCRTWHQSGTVAAAPEKTRDSAAPPARGVNKCMHSTGNAPFRSLAARLPGAPRAHGSGGKEKHMQQRDPINREGTTPTAGDARVRLHRPHRHCATRPRQLRAVVRAAQKEVPPLQASVESPLLTTPLALAGWPMRGKCRPDRPRQEASPLSLPIEARTQAR